MATIIHTARASGATPFDQGLSGLRTTLAERFARYRTYRTTLNELAQLTDRELADMGMHRADIRTIAHEAAYKA